MKKIIAVLAVIAALASCEEKKTEEVAGPATYMDSVSYALGLYTSKSFEDIKDSINQEQLFQGIRDAGDSLAIFEEKDVENILRVFSQKLQAEAQKEVMKEHDDYLAEVAKYDGVQSTPSGLMYKVISQGAGEKPLAVDTVVVNYTGKLKDGTVFDQGQGVRFPLNRVIPGWTEGIQLMSVGSSYELYIPQQLAYGPQGNRGIPPFSALNFQVELLEVVKAK